MKKTLDSSHSRGNLAEVMQLLKIDFKCGLMLETMFLMLNGEIPEVDVALLLNFEIVSSTSSVVKSASSG